MTKLLWHSNAPWAPTGYGQQTGLFAPRLAEKYDMARVLEWVKQFDSKGHYAATRKAA